MRIYILLFLLFKNIIAGVIGFVAALPFLFFFDITINGYFNPQYGVWSQSFLNGPVALTLSVFLGGAAIVVAMVIHNKITEAIT